MFVRAGKTFVAPVNIVHFLPLKINYFLKNAGFLLIMIKHPEGKP
jgi:hypothetical protein